MPRTSCCIALRRKCNRSLPEPRMDDRAFHQLMNSLKDAPEFGGGSSDLDMERSRQRLARELGWDEMPSPRKYTVWEYLEYLRYEAQHVLVRPLAAAGAAMGLVLGGWVTTVGASSARPGDILYPVKLASERVQLSFANSGGDRVRLHAEFAERRLQEAVDMTDDPSKNGLVQTAVTGFKNELNSAHGELNGLQKSSPKQAVEAAATLAAKADGFSAILSQSQETASPSVKADVAAAKEAAKSAQVQAVGSLVKTYEETKEPASADELQQNYRRLYQDATNRLATALGRLAVMRDAAKRVPVEQGNEFRAFASQNQNRLLPLQKNINDAANVMAAGGYSRAFDLLNEAERTLASVETAIVDKEIELSTIASEGQL